MRVGSNSSYSPQRPRNRRRAAQDPSKPGMALRQQAARTKDVANLSPKFVFSLLEKDLANLSHM